MKKITFLLIFLLTINLSTFTKDAEKAYVGIYLNNIYDLDIVSNSFHADFYIWVKWKGKINPMKHLELTNSIEKWSQTRVLNEKRPIITKDGFKYQSARLEGRFLHHFNLKKFPLDSHDIIISIENSKYPISKLVYLADSKYIRRREDFGIAGWRFFPLELKEKNINTTLLLV